MKVHSGIILEVYMFLYQSIPWYTVLMWFAVLGGLILVNELARINKWFSLAIFLSSGMIWVPMASVGTRMAV